jgi:D-glycero-beta-D-manno-heptose 1-phosphate adenylyltransferase
VARLYSIEALALEVSLWRASGLRIGLTCGAFDLLHAGHVDYLEKARELCDRLIVAVNSDASIREYKSPLRPILNERHRARLIGSLACVDAVTVMRESRPIGLIENLKPDVYIKGGDYQATGTLRSAPAVEAYGGRCIIIPVSEEISTTKIINRINSLSLHASPEQNIAPAKRGIIFLDRDGTLIRNVPFLNDSTRVSLMPGVGNGLKKVQDRGFALVVVTNQQGLDLGYFDYDTFVSINSEMLRQLSTFSVRISRFYFCPHSVDEECQCRKPSDGLLRRAMADFQVRPEDCLMIGDSQSDMEAAKQAGCEGFLVSDEPDAHSLSFESAVERILNTGSARRALKSA